MASSVWKGHITFGLVSFPVRLFSAARSETLSFNQLHKDDNSRIRQVTYCQLEDKPVPRSELVKGYEYEKDRYVVIDDEDIKKVAPKTAKVMEILEFVKATDVDPVYLESSYYVAPDEGGEKPYALLFQAMRESNYFALAKVAMHNREHVIVLRPGAKGILSHTMYYQDEIRQVDEFRTDTSLVKDKELDMAKMLISSLEAEFEPQKYHDSYRDNLRQMIEAKIEGKKVVETPEAHIAPVIDIMEALKKSLAEKRKPAQVATSLSRGRRTASRGRPQTPRTQSQDRLNRRSDLRPACRGPGTPGPALHRRRCPEIVSTPLLTQDIWRWPLCRAMLVARSHPCAAFECDDRSVTCGPSPGGRRPNLAGVCSARHQNADRRASAHDHGFGLGQDRSSNR